MKLLIAEELFRWPFGRKSFDSNCLMTTTRLVYLIQFDIMALGRVTRAYTAETAETAPRPKCFPISLRPCFSRTSSCEYSLAIAVIRAIKSKKSSSPACSPRRFGSVERRVVVRRLKEIDESKVIRNPYLNARLWLKNPERRMQHVCKWKVN
jgi:hypothetical protein